MIVSLGLDAASDALARSTGSGLNVLDLMPAFWRSFDRGKSLVIPGRIKALRDGFFSRHQHLYRTAGFAELDDASIARLIHHIDADRSSVQSAYQRLYAALPAVSAAYRRWLPDFDFASSSVVVMPSLLRFDGHLGTDGPRHPLFLGADAIPDFHPPGSDLKPFVAHELFHCYQAQRGVSLFTVDRPATLGELIWAEGTATFASERMFSRASLRDVLITPALTTVNMARAREAFAAMLELVRSRDETAKVKFFSADYEGRWPARMGYLAGLKIVRDAARSRDLRILASTNEYEALSFVTTGLSALLRA